PGARGTGQAPAPQHPLGLPGKVPTCPRRPSRTCGGPQPGTPQRGQAATTLTILPGTTMTLRTVRPSRYLAALGSARASAATWSGGVSAGTSVVPRGVAVTGCGRVAGWR